MAQSLDSISLPGRIARHARLSRTAGGLAARLALERFLGVPLDRPGYARRLRTTLGTLRGPVVKIAQLLATMPGAVPPEFAHELAGLQTNAPPMGWPMVKRRMAAELGADWRSRFRSFDRAAAAASLGQVHHAVDLDGRDLACKLQYPGIEAATAADMQQIKLALALFARYDRAISTDEVHTELSERLAEELDYRIEARNIALFAEILRDDANVHLPAVLPTLSTRRLLAMDWLEGEPVLACAARRPELVGDLAQTIFRAWYAPFFGYGVLHGDPHPGNYTVRVDGTLNLLDFGCIRVFPPALVEGVIDLYRAVQTGDGELAERAYRCWRFARLTKPMVEVLNIWARFIFEPLCDDRERTIHGDQDDAYGLEAAAKVHAELRRQGGVDVPREFVLMDRVAIALSALFIRLSAKANWHRLFEEQIAGFDRAALGDRQSGLLSRHEPASA